MKTKRLVNPVMVRVGQLTGIGQSEHAVVRASTEYWSGAEDAAFQSNSHWRGSDAVGAEQFAALGRRHLELYRGFAAMLGRAAEPKRVVDWGCGGGANAVAFAPGTERVVGVDVSEATLAECGRQMTDAGHGAKFTPFCAAVDDPETTAGRVRAELGGCDLFLCVYVLELLPGVEHAQRLLRIAHDLLADDGLALIQFKYQTSDWRSRSRRWGYRENLANTTVLEIEQFHHMADHAGLSAQAFKLIPEDPLVHDRRYAYAALTRS